MRVKTLVLAAAALFVATAALAHSHKLKNLEIVHPWCIETNDTADPVSVFMTIKNSGRPDKLLRATTSIAGKAELRGSSWSARNESERVIHKGERCLVHQVEGLTLSVRPEGVRG